jgi:hypothetical protein
MSNRGAAINTLIELGEYVKQYLLLLMLDPVYDKLTEDVKTHAAQLLADAGQVSKWKKEKE